MIFSIERFTAPNGIHLRYGFTRPENARAYVMILQGLGEFIERYDETARELATRGLGCVTFDFRGQPDSGHAAMRRTICYIDDLDEYVGDTHQVMSHARQQLGIEIDLLLSHSTGGLVGMKMLSTNPDICNSAVMIAPFFGLGGPDWLEFTARFLSRRLCQLGFARHYLPMQRHFFSELAGWNQLISVAKLVSGLLCRPRSAEQYSPQRVPTLRLQPFDPNNPLTSDRRRYARNLGYLSDNPELFVDGISVGWLNACLRAQTALADKAEHTILPPTTIVLSGADRIVDNRKTRAMFSDNPAVTITEIPAARHELLQERDHFRAQFWAAFDRHVSGCHAGAMIKSVREKISDPGAASDDP